MNLRYPSKATAIMILNIPRRIDRQEQSSENQQNLGIMIHQK